MHIHKTALPVVIDGEINEAAWQQADTAGNFFMVLPMATSGAKTATTVRMVYDANNIYISPIWFKESLPNQQALALAQENSCFRSKSPIQKLPRGCSAQVILILQPAEVAGLAAYQGRHKHLY